MKNNTHIKSTLLIVALTASSVSTQVFALDDMADANQTHYTTSFKALDVDNSNSLTKSEVKSEKLFNNHFNDADKDNDGSLDQEEYTNYKLKKKC
ncbi:MAG: hypothetical protein Q8J59_08420 [Methylotenera sp.]|nr:hypothetical protein [Methylotenera sp.]MDO9388523.1 hypothetical protein [Methylotenera sp.]MDP2101613.1 hypothetical protein [Methylotenera sp.]MDP2281698.1 hypothetical protein [Methylotenera sp.]MDP3059978.1 hypothetical protein [Methylotenera sp.]